MLKRVFFLGLLMMLCAQGVYAQTVKRIDYTDGRSYVGEVNASGQFHGYGTLTWSNGTKYNGQFKNGKKNGYGTYFWSNGQIYSGYFENDKRNGYGTYSWPDGQQFTGGWVNGVFSGYGTYTWSNGDWFTGQWVTGKKHGKGIMIKKDGTKLIQVYDNDKLVSSVDIEKQANEQSVASNTTSPNTTSKKQNSTTIKTPKSGDIYYYQNQGLYCAVLFLDDAIKVYYDAANSLADFKSSVAQTISSTYKIRINTTSSIDGKVGYYEEYDDYETMSFYYISCTFTNSFREIEYEEGDSDGEVFKNLREREDHIIAKHIYKLKLIE